MLLKALQLLMALSEFSLSEVSTTLKALCDEELIKLVALAQPLRIALTGGTTSPGVFELLAVLGKEESCVRIQGLLNFLVHKQ